MQSRWQVGPDPLITPDLWGNHRESQRTGVFRERRKDIGDSNNHWRRREVDRRKSVPLKAERECYESEGDDVRGLVGI